MGISGIGSNSSNVYQGAYASQKNEAARKAESKSTETKKAVSVQEGYYSYLQKNYDCVKNRSVAISGTYLKECAGNPEKAKELEESLAFFKEGYESGLRSARVNARAIGARLVNYSESWSIDNKGNITMMASTTVTSDDSIKGWRELKEEREEKLKAKELEDFLKKIPELERQGYEQLSARNKALGGTVTYYQQTWTVNEDGSIQSTVYSVTETGMTNAERMKKNMEERLEKQAEKKTEEKKVKEQKREEERQAKKMEVDIKKTFPKFDITV